MLDINIKDSTLIIKNISKDSIENIYSIYQNFQDFKYATGIFNSINYLQFSRNIIQFIKRDNVFFLDICLPSGESIGFIKGLSTDNNIAWINSLIINKPYQFKGYGRKVVSLLEKFLKDNCKTEKIYLSVYKSNIAGIIFWYKNGFEKCNSITEKEACIVNDSVQIMCKIL